MRVRTNLPDSGILGRKILVTFHFDLPVSRNVGGRSHVFLYYMRDARVDHTVAYGRTYAVQNLILIQFNSKEVIDRQDWEMTLGSVGFFSGYHLLLVNMYSNQVQKSLNGGVRTETNFAQACHPAGPIESTGPQ